MLETRALSVEEMRFFEASSGYDLDEYGTALDDIDEQFLWPDASKPFLTIAGGYQRLPVTLADEARRLGASVTMQSEVMSVIVPEQSGAPCRIAVRGKDGTSRELRANKLIFAMPRHALERIAQFPLRAEPRFASLIAAVEAMPALKSLVLYARPWWHDAGIDGGLSVTDMPARMFYPVGAEKVRLSSESAKGFGVLMMYCCGSSTGWWRAAAAAPPSNSGGFQRLTADSPVVCEIHREAETVYAQHAPAPLAGCLQDWNAGPYGGAWHYWALGRGGRALADQIVRPITDRELYICGEAYAWPQQAWAEGAIDRAEFMLQRHFGLVPPKWLA
ncbi:MAG TPA: FAD-dependent oxidoreductase [Rhizomicrobium sp.]|nr:FAD-dependent oxidoreductase [Rhizomicrobium sp.]